MQRRVQKMMVANGEGGEGGEECWDDALPVKLRSGKVCGESDKPVSE
jgi:hypothetical protein